ncbi:MAG TPA: PadR family transcriptional regulator [Candidatus Mediterraneibacter intestinigallinarum]|nr:PadR family transcriptional regulator [Candidatus Mediterraneibacter intestinigallinarum]
MLFSYSYQQIQRFSKDSTLYPVLKRLQENRYVETYDQQYQGRNRRYYRITPNGRQRQKELVREWEAFKFIIDDIVKGGISNDQK